MTTPRVESSSAKKAAEECLRRWTCCVRRPNMKRRKTDGHMAYKKGWEVRFSIDTPNDLRDLKTLLATMGLKCGKGYVKANRRIVPVYGQAAVEAFGL